MVLGKNLFHSVLWLAVALVSTAAIFLTLDAEFLAAAEAAADDASLMAYARNQLRSNSFVLGRILQARQL